MAATLEFTPVSNGYTMDPGWGVIEVELRGGANRKRLDVLGAPHIVNCTWILTKTEYMQFMAFFTERLQNSVRQFKCNLLTTAEAVIPHVCLCLGGAPKLAQQEGETFWVEAVLEVTPNPQVSYALFLQNVSSARVVDSGNPDFAGDMTDFPVGRQVQLINTRTENVSGSGQTLDLDGVYTIDEQPNSATITLLNAGGVNSDWITLNGLSPQSFSPAAGACILLPE